MNRIWLYILAIFFTSCNETNVTKGNKLAEGHKYDEIRSVNTFDSLILDKQLKQKILYVFDKVDSFPGWEYPIVYAISFKVNDISISIGKSIESYARDKKEYGCVGYLIYENRIIQIFDSLNNNANIKYYNSKWLNLYNDTILSPYAYNNGRKVDVIFDLNLTIPMLNLKLEKSNSELIVVSENLADGKYDYK